MSLVNDGPGWIRAIACPSRGPTVVVMSATVRSFHLATRSVPATVFRSCRVCLASVSSSSICCLTTVRPFDISGDTSDPSLLGWSCRHSILSSPILSDLGSELDGLNQTSGIGHALPDDIKRCSMIHGGADDRQAHGEIDARAEGDKFQGNEALIMVEGDDAVKGPFRGLPKEGVSRERITCENALFLGRSGSWKNHAGFLIPEQSMFTGVGIECSHSYPGTFDAEQRRQRQLSQADRFFNFCLGQQQREIFDRDMCRDEHDA